MFSLFKKKETWQESCKKLMAGQISEQEFVNKQASKKLYYATPFGEDVNGKPQLWVLSNKQNETKHYPAFTSLECCKAFFAAIGRREFIIVGGDLKSVLDSLDTEDILRPFGVVIDPDCSRPIAISPNIRAKK